MKVLLFTDNLGAGGAQRQLVGLATLLKEEGHDVSVSLYNNSMFYATQLSNANIKFEIVRHAANHFLRIPVMLRYFKKQSPDWIIAYQETPSIIASFAKLFLPKIKILVSERTTTQALTYIDKLRFILYRFTDSIVPNSYSQKKFIVDHFPSLAKKTETIINFVDFEKFKFITRTKRIVPEILIVSSIYPPKNTKNLIYALKPLKDSGIKFRVRWFGITDNIITPYIAECNKLISDLDLTDYIELKPKTKDINAEYEKADYLCLPSLFEGTPNVICEAMSTGLPIICSDVCDNRMYVKKGENGFLFDPTKPEKIAKAIGEAINLTNNDYINHCINSRLTAEKLFSSQQFIKKYLSIIEKK